MISLICITSGALNLQVCFCLKFFDYSREAEMVSTPTKSNSTRRFYPTRIDLAADVRSQVAALLNQTLAATLDLKTQTKQAHWNVKGMDFFQLHELFDEMASELEEYVDMVAERVTALGGTALGTARLAASNSILPEYDLDVVEGAEHVAVLAERFAVYARHVRAAIDQTDSLGDADTADLYTEISRTIDKRLWFLEAHLVKKSDLS
jgi:starvation-inducible DNA-binding protein